MFMLVRQTSYRWSGDVPTISALNSMYARSPLPEGPGTKPSRESVTMVIVPLEMTPGPNEVVWVPPDDRNGPSVTKLACKIVWSKERLNCQDVSSTASMIEMGIAKMSPTFFRTGTGPEPAVTIGTAWASAGQSTTLRRARVRTDRRSLRTVDLAIVDGRGLVSQLRYCTIVDAIFPPPPARLESGHFDSQSVPLLFKVSRL